MPPTTLGCICRDPYRPGTSLLYSFVFVPSLILQHPHRGTALFYPDASVSQTLIHPPHLGVSTPVWAETNLVPSLPLSISRGLTTPGSPLLPHTSFPPRRSYVHPQLSAPSAEDSPPLPHSVTVPDSSSPHIPPTYTDSPHCYHDSNFPGTNTNSLQSHAHPHIPTPGCVTSPRTTTSTLRAWIPGHTSFAHQSTATGNWPVPRVLTRGISSNRARAPSAPDEKGIALSGTSNPSHTLTHEGRSGGPTTRNF